MGTEKKCFLYQPSGSTDKKNPFDYASSAGCIAPDSWAAPATRAAGTSNFASLICRLYAPHRLGQSNGAAGAFLGLIGLIRPMGQS